MPPSNAKNDPLCSNMSDTNTPGSGHAEPSVIVIFGASGDLTHRKLIPSLFDLDRSGALPKGTVVLGVSRTPMSDDAFRDKVAPSIKKFSSGAHNWTAKEDAAWKQFASRVFYHAADGSEIESFPGLSERINALAAQHNIMRNSAAAGSPNILFYLSVSPNLYEPIIGNIGASGLITEGRRWCSIDPQNSSWQRIIVEKPFGVDTASAASLNRALGRVFEEESIFRIDHYLGKELVQNILVLRFANAIFEPIWNREHVDHIQVTACETVGVGSRAANYYDSGSGGALRDMVQSHLLQVLALVAMEPPSIFDAAAIMREKIKLFTTAIRATPAEAAKMGVFGRYGAGKSADGTKDEPAYVNEQGVDAARATETYAAIKLSFDNWRWNGVPFYLRSGKKMARKLTEVVVQFKKPPTNMFRHLGIDHDPRPANRIVINIAPSEGISLRIDGKVPGAGIRLASAKLDLDYAKTFGGEQIEAYGPLILDAIKGDRTLYKHRDEVESSWSICEPFLKSEALRKGIEEYPAASWGPAAADAMLNREGRAWHNPRPDEVR